MRRAIRKEVTQKNIIIAAYARGIATIQRGAPPRHARSAELAAARANTPKIAAVVSWKSCRSARQSTRKNPRGGAGAATMLAATSEL